MSRGCSGPVPGGAFVIFGVTSMGAFPQWEIPRCAAAAGLRAPALARAPRSRLTLRVDARCDGKRLESAGTSREKLSRESPLLLLAHAFVCEPRRSVPLGDCGPREAAMRPIEPGATAGKVARGPDPGQFVGRRRGTCPAASSPSAPAGPGSRRSWGKRGLRGGKKSDGEEGL